MRHGFGRAQDVLPRRFTEEPLEIFQYTPDPNGGLMKRSAEPIKVGLVEDLDGMLTRYYMLRGWDANGHPTPETLSRLDISQ